MPPLAEMPRETGNAVFYLQLQNSQKLKADFLSVRNLLESVRNINIHFVIRTSLKLVHRRAAW